MTERMTAPDKGLHDGACNRSACQRPIAGNSWFNRGTDAYYCQACAFAINRANSDASLVIPNRVPPGEELCVRATRPVCDATGEGR